MLACVCNISVLQSQGPTEASGQRRQLTIYSFSHVPLFFFFLGLLFSFKWPHREVSIPRLPHCLLGIPGCHTTLHPSGLPQTHVGAVGGGSEASVPQTLHKGAELFKQTKEHATQRLGQLLVQGSRAERTMSFCSPCRTSDRAPLGPGLLWGTHTSRGAPTHDFPKHGLQLRAVTTESQSQTPILSVRFPMWAMAAEGSLKTQGQMDDFWVHLKASHVRGAPCRYDPWPAASF